MGADLYIRSLSDAADAAYRPMFEAAVSMRDIAAENAKNADTPESKDAYERLQKLLQEQVTKAYDAMFEHDGYFRDSYNSTGVLQYMGLSWWADVVPLCEDGILPILKARVLRQMIMGTSLQVPSKQELIARRASIDDADPENDYNSWVKYFTEKREKLIAFLDRAIQRNESIDASL